MKNLFKSKYAKTVIVVAVIAVIAIFMALTAPQPGAKQTAANMNNAQAVPAGTNQNANAPINASETGTTAKKTAKPVSFTLKNTPHFVSSTIANNATLSQMPGTLTLSFNASINKTTGSYIYVKKNDITSVTRGQSFVDDTLHTLSVNLNQTVESGDYYVYYVACFADTGCKDGRFGFHLKLPQ
jgi:methionine-rich copper-binding protein CopC